MRSAAAATVARRKNLIEQAANLAMRWEKLPASNRRAFLKVLIDRIIIQPKTIDITICINAIPVVVKPDLNFQHLPLNVDGSTRQLSVPAQLKRTGMETKLLIQGSRGPRKNKTDRSLLRLIGQAHRYRNILDAADPNTSMAEVAKHAGVSSSYFTRVLRLSFIILPHVPGAKPVPTFAEHAPGTRYYENDSARSPAP